MTKVAICVACGDAGRFICTECGCCPDCCACDDGEEEREELEEDET
jgi:hypothetical protein